jgi:hypothetical protein
MIEVYQCVQNVSSIDLNGLCSLTAETPQGDTDGGTVPQGDAVVRDPHRNHGPARPIALSTLIMLSAGASLYSCIGLTRGRSAGRCSLHYFQ